MIVAQVPEDDEPPQVSMLPRREHLTAVQIGNMLSVLNMLGAFLKQSDEESYGKPEHDGGVKSAVAASVYHALNRLDSIITDNSRWGMESHLHMERLIAANLKASIDVAESHQRTQELLRCPHISMQPTLRRLDDGSWIAWVGGIEDELVGFGPTPIDALLSFDRVVLGDIDHAQHFQQVQALCKPKSKKAKHPKTTENDSNEV